MNCDFFYIDTDQGVIYQQYLSNLVLTLSGANMPDDIDCSISEEESV